MKWKSVHHIPAWQLISYMLQRGICGFFLVLFIYLLIFHQFIPVVSCLFAEFSQDVAALLSSDQWYKDCCGTATSSTSLSAEVSTLSPCVE
jgi:hypothetical protein